MMAPSLTLQYFIRPSQPVRSLPLKNSLVESSARVAGTPVHRTMRESRARQNKVVRMGGSPGERDAAGGPSPGGAYRARVGSGLQRKRQKEKGKRQKEKMR